MKEGLELLSRTISLSQIIDTIMPPSKKISSKKKGGTRKEKDATGANKPGRRSQESTAALVKILLVLVSFLVAIAAVLLRPMIEESGTFQGWQKNPIVDQKEEQDDMSAWPPSNPRVGLLLSKACQSIYCHDGLKVSKRYFRATESIEPGEILFKIPKSMQIWDLEALRDPWIRLHLFEASHKLSGNRVGSEAFLAAYLALQKKRIESEDDVDVLKVAYFDSLQPLTYFDKNHPLWGSDDSIRRSLGFSEGYGVLQSYRNMVLSEFEAFSEFSKKFKDFISRNEYVEARMHVLTRAIRIGPPGPEQAIKGSFLKNDYTDEQLLDDELEAYKDILNIDLKGQGCIALVPIADLFNHHPNNNVEYEYHRPDVDTEGMLVIRADHRRIETGFEPMVNYGTMADAHLYARYGFVNGDGSALAQVSLAFHHDILMLNISGQYDYFPTSGMTSRITTFMEKALLNYLRFDDGYGECIPGPNTHPEEADLKLLKHRHLMKIGNKPEHWQILVPARNAHSFPNITHEHQITLAPPQHIPWYAKAHLVYDLPLATCRLISLINSDFDGTAVQMLRDNINNDSFVIKEGDSALEFRSRMCVVRWLKTGLEYLERDGSMRSEYDRVSSWNRDGSFGSTLWSGLHVRFGEMQALEAAYTVILEEINDRWGDIKEDRPTEYKTMLEPCPEEYLKFLSEEASRDQYMIDW